METEGEASGEVLPRVVVEAGAAVDRHSGELSTGYTTRPPR